MGIKDYIEPPLKGKFFLRKKSNIGDPVKIYVKVFEDESIVMTNLYLVDKKEYFSYFINAGFYELKTYKEKTLCVKIYPIKFHTLELVYNLVGKILKE